LNIILITIAVSQTLGSPDGGAGFKSRIIPAVGIGRCYQLLITHYLAKKYPSLYSQDKHPGNAVERFSQLVFVKETTDDQNNMHYATWAIKPLMVLAKPM
jgi:hypothetical protein